MANKNEETKNRVERRTALSQSDIPAFPLNKALQIAKAIADNYAFKPATPLDVASAMRVAPTTGGFRMLTGASLAYGLTTASWSASEIGISALGLRIVRPLSDESDIDKARREAVLTPRIVGDFLKKYDGAALPKPDIAQNVLMTMGVPPERTKDALGIILENADCVGFLRKINDKTFVDLKGTPALRQSAPTNDSVVTAGEAHDSPPLALQENPLPTVGANPNPGKAKRVFITHGKNRALIEPIKKLLAFGDLEAVVAVQSPTVAQPVPTKIMEDMRSCGAAIIHVESERTLVDGEGNPEVVLNPNVLIEIGAAMALFGQRFILVVKDGVKLPSNLQGLLELRYKGDTLDVNDTVSLLTAMADMKARPLPS